MIETVNKSNCCGCGLCIDVCPKTCIQMNKDIEGFLYPESNNNCISCGFCIKKCPARNMPIGSYPQKGYMSFSLDKDERLQGSSGGIFGVAARHIISNGGVVFGARFNENLKLGGIL